MARNRSKTNSLPAGAAQPHSNRHTNSPGGEGERDAAPGEALLAETAEFWQSYADDHLTHEDARQMVENIAGVFSILSEWDSDAQRESAVPVAGATRAAQAQGEELATGTPAVRRDTILINQPKSNSEEAA